MDWLNLHTSTLDSPEFVGSSPVERSTWLCLQRFCIGQENGGRIVDARGWKDRQWQQLARVTLREVGVGTRLWRWDGDDLVVAFYPKAKEDEVKSRRELARQNGANGGRPKKTDVGIQKKPTLVNSGKAEGEGEGEGKEKGNNTPPPPVGGQAAPAAEVAPVAPASTERDPASKPRPRNPLFDALAAATDGPPDKLTSATARAVGVALAEIRKVHPDLTPEEITRRAANYRAHFRDAVLTAGALAKHWARCDAAPRATSALSTDMGIDELKRRHGGTF